MYQPLFGTPRCNPILLALIFGLVGVAFILSLDSLDAFAGAFPGDNGLIAFDSIVDPDSHNLEIYVMNTDGSGRTMITDNAAYDTDPIWSPDGNKIAFGSTRDGNYEIYVMNADGSSQTRLTNDAAVDNYPSWSPDGSKIVFTSERNGPSNFEIYVMNADGSSQTRLTDSSGADEHPSWSPDGSKIAFSSTRDGNYEIYVMNADGSGQVRLTNNDAFDNDPSWSPDGKKIAFETNRDGPGNNVEVYSMNADGSSQTRLTDSTGDDTRPGWSPDGKKIAFESSRDGRGVYVMNADGSSQARISDTSAIGDENPDWGSSIQSAPQKWTIKGFYAPVDLRDSNGNVIVNTIKNGQGVPLKFEVFDETGHELTDTSAVSSITKQKVSCSNLQGDSTDAIEQVVTTGNTQLTYDQTSGQFIQNWKTPKSPGSCYEVTVTTGDGSSIQAYFKLK